MIKDWTFKTNEIADNFNSHVREQLPWYDMIIESITFIAKHYIPYEGVVYDLGASTGNISEKLLNICKERNVDLILVENSLPMAEILKKKFTNVITDDITDMSFENFDVAILNLVLMFLSPINQERLLENLYDSINIGGSIIIVDKIHTNGYFGQIMKRLTMFWKLKNGASLEDIIHKELSLVGIQRPINNDLLIKFNAKQFFQFGDFVGWIIEK